MTISKIAVYITLFLCFACESGKEVTPEIILPEPSSLEKILTRGSLEISTFYNTTDYYVYRGITRGFHYDLARDFAGYLGVNLRIVEVNNDIDTAIGRLQSGKYDLLAVSLTQTPERNEQLRFSKPLFQTREVLVQNKNSQPIKDMAQLDGKEIYIPKSATSYKKVLQQIQDSLNIHIYITEIEHYSYEDLLHLVETGEINYTVIDENIAQASSYSMKNLDIALKLKEDISVSWATHSDASLLSSEINNWLEEIRKYLPERKENTLDSEENGNKEVGMSLKKPHNGKLRILDVGCGTGFFTILLAKQGHQVTGTDLTPDMVANSRILAKEEQVNCNFEIMDAEHLSFADNSFDVVISRNLTWTLPEAAQAYKEWTRVLKPGGVLLNFDANYGAVDFAETSDLPENHAHNQLGNSLMQECEDIKRQLPISSYLRPAWDVEELGKTGMEQISIDLGLSRRVYKEKDEFYNPTPMFAIAAKKA